MKSFKSYLKEYGVLNPAFAVGGSATGPGMGQYNPTSDLNLRASKQAVSGGKVAKFITGNNVTFQGKKYKKVELDNTFPKYLVLNYEKYQSFIL